MDAEHLPRIILPVGDTERVVTPRNGSLYQFVGRLGMYDHIWLEFDDDENDDENDDDTDKEVACAAIFKLIHPETYEQIAKIMRENNFPIHLNLRKIDDADVEAYNFELESMVADEGEEEDDLFIPEDWDKPAV